MKKKTQDTNGGPEGDNDSPRDAPEFVDPITLAIMEEAVMVPCGHSFSKASITGWLRQAGGAKVCPVCKSPISEQSLVPNWALRNAIDRYNESCDEKYGRKTPPHHSSAVDKEDDTKVQASSWVDTEDTYPIKPSAPPAAQLRPNFFHHLASPAAHLSASPSFTDEDDQPVRPAPISSTSTSSPSSNSAPAYAIAAAAVGGGGGDDSGGCDCDCFERPTGKYGCWAWECEGCGVCKMADDCSGGACWLFSPITTATCLVSFGKWSNWYTRTFCGSIYPLFVALVLLLLCADLVIICIFWTVWSFYIPLAMLFFLMTHYFCPCFNKKVDSMCGPFAFQIGSLH